jgi:putative oxidoreductase
MTRSNDVLALIGRILIAALFLPSGLSKLAAPAATQAYITAMGLPAPALICYGAMIVELVGSILLIVGFQTRFAAYGLAIFTLLAAFLFHTNFADQNQMIHFFKNFAIVGGLLYVGVLGAGKISLDRRSDSTVTPSAAALTPGE